MIFPAGGGRRPSRASAQPWSSSTVRDGELKEREARQTQTRRLGGPPKSPPRSIDRREEKPRRPVRRGAAGSAQKRPAPPARRDFGQPGGKRERSVGRAGELGKVSCLGNSRGACRPRGQRDHSEIESVPYSGKNSRPRLRHKEESATGGKEKGGKRGERRGESGEPGGGEGRDGGEAEGKACGNGNSACVRRTRVLAVLSPRPERGNRGLRMPRSFRSTSAGPFGQSGSAFAIPCARFRRSKRSVPRPDTRRVPPFFFPRRVPRRAPRGNSPWALKLHAKTHRCRRNVDRRGHDDARGRRGVRGEQCVAQPRLASQARGHGAGRAAFRGGGVFGGKSPSRDPKRRTLPPRRIGGVWVRRVGSSALEALKTLPVVD